MNWYVLYCKRGYRYYERLLSLNLQVCEPVYLEIKKGKTGIEVSSEKKLCPGYIFIKCDITVTSPMLILSVPGIIAFLKADNVFYQVPDSIIDSLRGLPLKTDDPFLKSEIDFISTAKTKEERESRFLTFLKKHNTAGGPFDVKCPLS